MRIGGLASGMDTDQIVRDLMRVQRMPLDKLTQQKQRLEWQRDSYRELNTAMTKFRDNIFDTVMRSANMNSKKVTSSNSSFVTATATSAASNGSYTIAKVDQLASAATNVSQGKLSVEGGPKIDLAKDLFSQKALFEGDFNWKKGTVQKETVSFTEAKSTLELSKKNFVDAAQQAEAMSVKVNGKAYTVVTSPSTIEDLEDGQVLFNSTTGVLDFGEDLAVGASVAVTYATVSDENYFTSSVKTFNADGESRNETFAFSGTKTLNQVISEVNNSTSGINMFYDSFTDKVTVQRNETGNFNSVEGAQSNLEATTLAYDEAIIAFNDATTALDEANLYFTNIEGDLNTAINDAEGNLTQATTDYDAAVVQYNSDPSAANEIAVEEALTAKETAESDLETAQNDKLAAEAEVAAAEAEVTRTSNEVTITEAEKIAAEDALTSPNLGKEMIFQGSFFTNVLKLDTTKELGGDNAKFTINGLETERNSNTFNINGVTITLKDKFDTPPANLNISTDVDKVFDTVVGFINEYNELLEKVNGKLTEDYYRDFKPLTDEQKEEMSEKDIERWEEKAMSGLLRRDQTLSSGLDRLRMNIYSPVSDNNNNSSVRQLTDLGVTTTKNYMDRGKLEIDESKLRAAIENDPEGIFQLFTADGPTNADKGIARRMRDSLDATMRSVSERAGGSYGNLQNHQFTLGRNLNDIETRVSNFERRLQQVEDRYWKQFTAMEKAMQQANSQADQMFSMLNGNQGQQ